VPGGGESEKEVDGIYHRRSKICMLICQSMSKNRPGSSVGIATVFGLDGDHSPSSNAAVM
jgi:hypothetical protein